jgi:hypothetical protein
VTSGFEMLLFCLGVKRSAVRIRPARQVKSLVTDPFPPTAQLHKLCLICQKLIKAELPDLLPRPTDRVSTSA